MNNNSNNNGSSEWFAKLWRWFLVLTSGAFGYVILRKLFGRSRPASRFLDDLLESPFLDDDEEVRLRPVSVNTYVYVLPTHQTDDGIFVKLLIENTSELATENV